MRRFILHLYLLYKVVKSASLDYLRCDVSQVFTMECSLAEFTVSGKLKLESRDFSKIQPTADRNSLPRNCADIFSNGDIAMKVGTKPDVFPNDGDPCSFPGKRKTVEKHTVRYYY